MNGLKLNVIFSLLYNKISFINETADKKSNFFIIVIVFVNANVKCLLNPMNHRSFNH